MQSNELTCRILAYQAVAALDRGESCDMALVNAKLEGVERLLDSARTGMEIFAAAGLSPHRPLQRLLRDSFHIMAPAGTSDIQRLRLAEHMLGLDGKTPWSTRFTTAQPHATET